MIRFILAFFFLIKGLHGEDCCYDFLPYYKGSIGPEIYHVKRTREGGTSQSGGMIGVRGSFERIARYKWYIGIEGLYGQGTINGHSGSGLRLKSKLTDIQIEARAGYTFQAKSCLLPAFTPFIGYGYLEEENNYLRPSPLLVKLKNEAQYVSFGFLSSITFSPELTAGFNLKAKSLVDPVCRVKGDPVFGHLKMFFVEKIQYRFEFPFYYDFYRYCQVFEVGLVPFYEFRHYGRRENYPFDFLDTKLNIWGLNLQLTYRF